MIKENNPNLVSDLEQMIAQDALRQGNTQEGNIPPPREDDPFGMPAGGAQTASAFGNFVKAIDKKVSKWTSGLTDPHTQDIVEAGRKADPAFDDETQEVLSETLEGAAESPPAAASGGPEGAPPISPLEDTGIDPAAVQQRMTEGGVPEEKRTDMRNLNIERHHPGAAASPEQDLLNAETSDDIAKVFDAVAEEVGEAHKVRSHKSIEDKMSDLDAVKEALGPVLSGEQQGLMNDTQLYAARSLLTTMGDGVATLANQISKGNATPEMLLQYQKQVKAVAAFQGFLRKNVRETARALSQQNMIAKTLKGGSIADIDELLNVAHMTPEQIQRHAKVMAESIDANGPIAGTKPGKLERLNDTIALAAEYWKASILSGVETHFVNISSNAAYNGWENLVIRPVAAGIGASRNMMSGNKVTDRVYMGETMGALASGYAGLRDGLEVAWRTLSKDESLFLTQGKGEAQGRMQSAAAGIENPALGAAARGGATMMNMPFRFLQAEDDLFKTVAYRQEVTALSLRQAYGEGLEGTAARKRAVELMKDPSDQIHEDAMMYAKNLTYTNTESPGLLGLLGQSAKKLSAAYPALQFVTPFINTPVNLMQRAVDMSALAVVNPAMWKEVKKGGAARDTALAKMATGAAFTATVYHYYEQGMITGNGPENWNQKGVLEKTGWQANSIKVDGKYIPYRRTDPFAAAIAGMVDTLDAAKYAATEEDAAMYMKAAVFGIAGHMMDGTFLRGASDTFKMIDGNVNAANYFSNYTTGFIPLSGAVRTVTKLVDPQLRKVSDDKEFQTGFMHRTQQKLKQSIPGMSFSLRPSRHWDGSIKKPEQGRMAYAMSPIKITNDKGATKVDQELIKNGVPIPEPSPMITLGRGATAVHVSLMDMDKGDGMLYDKYFQRVGDRRKEILQQLVADDGYKELTPGPGGERALKMRAMLHKAKLAGLDDFLENDLMPMYRKEPEAFTEVAKVLGYGRDELYEKVERITEGNRELEGRDAEFMEHVRKGRGKLEEPIPMPTQKVKPEKPFEVGF